MKISIKRLKEIIKEEIESSIDTKEEITLDEGSVDVMDAIADIPKTAQAIADKIRKDIENLAKPSGLDPVILAEAVAALLTAD